MFTLIARQHSFFFGCDYDITIAKNLESLDQCRQIVAGKIYDAVYAVDKAGNRHLISGELD